MLLLVVPAFAFADDVYRWVQDGAEHFTNNPDWIPKNYRGKVQKILKISDDPGAPRRVRGGSRRRGT